MNGDDLFKKIQNREEPIAVVGLGYVGLPLAYAFAAKGLSVVGFDVNEKKIAEYRAGIDPTHEVGSEELKKVSIQYTTDPSALKRCRVIIVAVPTPVTEACVPDLTPLLSASECVGKNLSAGTYVSYESTVYPGATEVDCIPILEKASGLKAGKDFKVGYSPERINPGDKEHRLATIPKVVSGQDADSLNLFAKLYGIVVQAGIHRAESIKVAEASKVIENAQRDINIAFVNELSMIFDRMGIDTAAVLRASGTKWNFLRFTPGLVGGHCIGVDPYYLSFKAQEVGYHAAMILAGRRINDGMGRHVAQKIVKLLGQQARPLHQARVAIFGVTFKENVPDLRNSKVIDIARELQEFGVEVLLTDPQADAAEFTHEYGLKLCDPATISSCDAVCVAVGHQEYRDFNGAYWQRISRGKPILVDLKRLYAPKSVEAIGGVYWGL